MASVVVGAGGLAREVARYVGSNVRGFIGLPEEVGETHCGFPIIGTNGNMGRFGDDSFYLAVGSPSVKRKILDEVQIALRWPVLVAKGALIADLESVELCPGVIIAPGAVITCDVAIGRWSFVNLNATVGHDVVIGERCQINPGANISGHVSIGDGVLVGAGAQVLEGLTIGGGAIVGAGAVVTRDVEPDVTVFGVPARRFS